MSNHERKRYVTCPLCNHKQSTAKEQYDHTWCSDCHQPFVIKSPPAG